MTAAESPETMRAFKQFSPSRVSYVRQQRAHVSVHAKPGQANRCETRAHTEPPPTPEIPIVSAIRQRVGRVRGHGCVHSSRPSTPGSGPTSRQRDGGRQTLGEGHRNPIAKCYQPRHTEHPKSQGNQCASHLPALLFRASACEPPTGALSPPTTPYPVNGGLVIASQQHTIFVPYRMFATDDHQHVCQFKLNLTTE